MSYPGWEDLDRIRDTSVLCESVGYVIKKTRTLLVLAATKDTTGDMYSLTMGRLRNCITKLKVLKV
jgi:hypothetical protein